MSDLTFWFVFKRWLLVDSNTACTQTSGKVLFSAWLLLLSSPLFSRDRDLGTSSILDSSILLLLCNVFKSFSILSISTSGVLPFPTHRQFFWLHWQIGIITVCFFVLLMLYSISAVQKTYTSGHFRWSLTIVHCGLIVTYSLWWEWFGLQCCGEAWFGEAWWFGGYSRGWRGQWLLGLSDLWFGGHRWLLHACLERERERTGIKNIGKVTPSPSYMSNSPNWK